MSEYYEFRGITWDHPRGYESIIAVSDAFRVEHPDVKITWDIRSLKDFGDYPVTELAKKYDFIMMDHPHIGSAVKAGALVPLDRYLSEEFLRDQEENSVGRSYESYRMSGHQWALAVDAAAQISAYREDLLKQNEEKIPKNWRQVAELAKRLSGNTKLAIPLCQTDSYCCFLSLCANHGGEQVFSETNGIANETMCYALELLSEIVPYLHEKSLDMNPIQALDLMADTNEIAYIPLLFGYSNYSRRNHKVRHLIKFTDIPSETNVPSGALLGGVGLAVSSECKKIPTAIEFVKFALCEKNQKGIYFEHAGQPGYLKAWKDPEVNAASNGFFENTLATLRNSYLRPRYEGYNIFQEKAGLVINEGLKKKMSPESIAEELEALFQKLKAGE